MPTFFRNWWRARTTGPYVRPWGLATPILVLVVCLPMLRPLLRPVDVSDNEKARLATIQAIVEQRTLRIDQTAFADTLQKVRPARRTAVHPREAYSRHPPMLAAMLAGPYWVLHRVGISFDENPTLAVYLLTLLGSTMPVALTGGLLYRMGRTFELRRAWRMTLAIAGVFGTGLVSYATVLNAHAPAAALALAGTYALLHASVTRSQGNGHASLAAAGFFLALAGVIDFGALLLLALLMPAVLALRWNPASRIIGLFWYAAGAVVPLTLHAALTIPITGDIRPGFLHPELVFADSVAIAPAMPEDADEDSWLSVVEDPLGQFCRGIIGSRGVLSHFPVLVFGIIGALMVIHRHWSASTKWMAMASVLACPLVAVAYVLFHAKWDQPMFATRWFIPFLPILLFWAGAWLRRRHHLLTWAMAGVLLVFSLSVTVLGATDPFLSAENGRHTAIAALRQLFRPQAELKTPATRATTRRSE